MNKRTVSVLLLLLLSGQYLMAQGRGINFFKGTWQEAVDKSVKENKKIFLDCYTVWCGPCKNLADTVFTQTNVGDFYNANYVNVQLDMEKDDGRKIAARYAVNQFPDMLYFNPGGFLVDRLAGLVSGRELLEQGKKTVENAPKNTLDEQFAKGGYDDSAFLKKYFAYLIDNYYMVNYQFVFEEIMKIKGEDALYEKKYWDILGAATTGSRAGLFLVNNRDKFAKIYGDDAVDEKITSMYFNISYLNNYEEAFRDPNMRDKANPTADPYDLFKERLKTRHVPNPEFLAAMLDFYRKCRANKRKEAFEIADKALVNAKPWQYHQFALLGDWLSAGRMDERAKIAVWANLAVDKAKAPVNKKLYKNVMDDLRKYAPDLDPKPMIYDFTI